MALKTVDLMDAPPPPKASDYLIYPWLQPGRLTLMVGATETGKTTLTVEMLAACAKGELLFGRYPTKRIHSVLYLHAEHSIYTVQEIAQKRGDIPHDLVTVIHEFGGYGSAMIQDQRPNIALLREIGEVADRIKPSLIIAEPISAFLASSENDNKEARMLIQILTSLGAKYNAAVLTHHHFGKSSFDPEHQRPQGIPTGESRGAMAFEDAAERILYLKRDASHIKIETPKPKGYPVATIHLKRDEDTLKFSLFTDTPGPDIIGLCASIRSKPPAHKSILTKKFAEAWKCTESYVSQLYKRAETVGLVSPDGHLIEGESHV
jgi:hypothetical protein